MAVREGAWDCTYCGHARNRGPQKYCSGCGAARGKDVVFYLPEDAAEVTDARALAEARAGADWTCGACGGDNKAGAGFCSGCGAPRDGGSGRAARVLPTGAAAAPSRRGMPQPAVRSVPHSGPTTLQVSPRGAGLLLLGLILFCAFSGWFGRDRDVTLRVDAISWERTIEIERLQTFTEQAWEGEVPAGARRRGTEQAIHHYDQIQTGFETRTRTRTERVLAGTRTLTRTRHERVQTGSRQVKTGVRDLGNGYFEDVFEDQPVYEDRPVTETYEEPVYENRSYPETYQEPVYRQEPRYAQRVTYDIDRWVVTRTERARGDDAEAAWPTMRLAEGERAGRRAESYGASLSDGGDVRLRKTLTSFEDWRRLAPGSSHPARATKSGRVLTLDGAPVEAAR